MYRIETTNKFEKDMKLMRKRNLPLEDLFDVVELLADGKPLPTKYKDHPLKGNYRGTRECHIHPDWLLVYQVKEEVELLCLLRTGSHSNLF